MELRNSERERLGWMEQKQNRNRIETGSKQGRNRGGERSGGRSLGVGDAH